MNQHQTIQSTKGGIVSSSLDDQTKNRNIDDYTDTVSKFEAAITSAGTQGIPYIETSKEVIQKVFPLGLGSAGYVIYKNVRVYEYGTAAKLIQDEKTPLHVKMGDAFIKGR